MDYENKVGAGILTICILYFIFGFLALIGLLFVSSMGVSTASIIPSAIISIILLVACIMILSKERIGVFLYFFSILADIIQRMSYSGFTMQSLLLSLILPLLMALFISKKKELYGF